MAQVMSAASLATSGTDHPKSGRKASKSAAAKALSNPAPTPTAALGSSLSVPTASSSSSSLPQQTDSGVASLAASSSDVSAPTSHTEKKLAFAEIVHKRLRTLKKRLAKIEKYETSPLPSLNPDQVESLKSKPIVSSLIHELSEIAQSLSTLEIEESRSLKKLQKQNYLEKQAAVARAVNEAYMKNASLMKFAIKAIVALTSAIEGSIPMEAASLNVLEKARDIIVPQLSEVSSMEQLSAPELDASMSFLKKVSEKSEEKVTEFEEEEMTYKNLYEILENLVTPVPPSPPAADTTEAEVDPATPAPDTVLTSDSMNEVQETQNKSSQNAHLELQETKQVHQEQPHHLQAESQSEADSSHPHSVVVNMPMDFPPSNVHLSKPHNLSTEQQPMEHVHINEFNPSSMNRTTFTTGQEFITAMQMGHVPPYMTELHPSLPHVPELESHPTISFGFQDDAEPSAPLATEFDNHQVDGYGMFMPPRADSQYEGLSSEAPAHGMTENVNPSTDESATAAHSAQYTDGNENEDRQQPEMQELNSRPLEQVLSAEESDPAQFSQNQDPSSMQQSHSSKGNDERPRRGRGGNGGGYRGYRGFRGGRGGGYRGGYRNGLPQQFNGQKQGNGEGGYYYRPRGRGRGRGGYRPRYNNGQQQQQPNQPQPQATPLVSEESRQE